MGYNPGYTWDKWGQCPLITGVNKPTYIPLTFLWDEPPSTAPISSPLLGDLPTAQPLRICVSPDYILVHEDAEQQLIDALKAAVARMTPENAAEKLGKA